MPDLVDELMLRIAELERKLDGMVRHGPVEQRKKIDGEWHVRIKTGGTEEKPTLSPWLPYTSLSGGPQGLNIHAVPQLKQNMTMISPGGDPSQALLVPMFWSDEHKPPSEDEDEVVITHPKFKLSLKDGNLTIEPSENITFKAKKAMTFDAGEKINLKAAGSELELKGGHANLVGENVHTVGKTHLAVKAKDEEGKKKAMIEGGMIQPRIKTTEDELEADATIAAMQAAIAAAGSGGGGGGGGGA